MSGTRYRAIGYGSSVDESLFGSSGDNSNFGKRYVLHIFNDKNKINKAMKIIYELFYYNN